MESQTFRFRSGSQAHAPHDALSVLRARKVAEHRAVEEELELQSRRRRRGSSKRYVRWAVGARAYGPFTVFGSCSRGAWRLPSSHYGAQATFRPLRYWLAGQPA